MRILELPANKSSAEWGEIHGESFRGEIHSLAEIRLYLTHKLSAFTSEEEILSVAGRHLAVLESFDKALYEEFMGISRGASISPELLVILNHYTDLRDLSPAVVTIDVSDPGGCSILLSHGESNLLGQTWDMHATAIPYAMLLKVPPKDECPGALVLSLTGCLGMAGMNEKRVAIAINNLHSTDAHVGIVWSALVRKAISHDNATAGCDEILKAPIGSGHHYLIADSNGAFAIETSGKEREVIFSSTGENNSSFFHTNHCLDKRIAIASRVPAGSTTFDRFTRMEELAVKPVQSLSEMWGILGSQKGYPRSICTNMATPQNPHGAATCAAIAMDLDSGEVWAVGGFPHNVEAEKYSVGDL